MNVLVVGSGGREHAIAWALARSPSVKNVVVTPGNGGTEWTSGTGVAPCRRASVTVDDFDGLVGLARERQIGLTVVGPEAPLAAGLVNRFRNEGLKIFGPTRKAAQIEASKTFAKDLMTEASIPTARYQVFEDYTRAREALGSMGWPVVLKADGLAAGKGVVVTSDRELAERALEEMMVEERFGAAGRIVLMEEHLSGPELSVMGFCDGKRVAVMPSARDHKRLLDGDAGPNTGGMGAFCPVPEATPELLDEVRRQVLIPALQALERRGTPFVGFLYAGLMLTDAGIKVLEFNCRCGDPEAQAVFPLLEADAAEIMLACAEGQLEPSRVRWTDRCAATVVMASPGYPGAYPRGLPIQGLEQAATGEALIFHAGTERRPGQTVTAGGRVLAVTGLGTTPAAALDQAYEALEGIEFEGAHYRRDIGAAYRTAPTGGRS